MNEYQNHKDTFTHGDPIQKQTAKWYFHKFGSTYKAGTYKGLDVSIGKGEGVAAGGILLRSLMPITLQESVGSEMRFANSTDKASFVEGPCNCVNRILDETKPEETKSTWDIKDLVARDDFSLDIFCEASCLRLISSSEDRKIVLPQRAVYSCPRVGLTLKRHDLEKEKYWMADYRFLTFPALHSKMKDYIILSQLAKG